MNWFELRFFSLGSEKDPGIYVLSGEWSFLTLNPRSYMTSICS